MVRIVERKSPNRKEKSRRDQGKAIQCESRPNTKHYFIYLIN